MPMIEPVVEISGIFDMRLALRWVAHDRCRILEGVADIAVEVAAGPDYHIDRIGGTVIEARRSVETAAVKGPADVLFVHRVANGAQRRWRHGGAGVDGSRVELAVGKETRPRVVDHVKSVW